MKSKMQSRTAKFAVAVICGIVVFLCEYLLLLPQCMRFDDVFEALCTTRWWVSVLGQILLIPCAMVLCANCSNRDWGYLLITATVQVFLLPIFYMQATTAGGIREGGLTWLILGGFVLARVLIATPVQILLLIALGRAKGKKEGFEPFQ